MLYDNNIEYLQKRSSNVTFDHIVGATGFDLYDIETAADGSLSFLAGKDSKVQIHSRRDPEGEARRQVDSWIERDNPELDGLVIACGFGGMYHIKEIASRLQPGALLLVVEKYPGIIRKALDHCDLSKLVCPTGTCIVFIASESDEELKREYRHYLQTRKNFKLSLFLHPGLSRAFPGFYEALAALLKEESNIELFDRNTNISLGQKWLEHLVCNIPAIFSSPDIECLRDRHKGMAAVMVAAGPSLDESSEYIGKVRDKVIVVAVGRALKLLFAKGITPDYVVTMDSEFVTLQQFEGVDLSGFSLICDTISYPTVVSMFAGRKRFFFSSGALGDFDKWLEAAGVAPAHLYSGGTVALSAIDMARFLGCRTIFLMGLDLAFKDDGTTHAKGLQYKEKESGCGRMVQLKGNCKDWVLATEQFRDYVTMLNSYLGDMRSAYSVEFYNVTSQGAALENCELLLPPLFEDIVNRPSASSAEAPETANETVKEKPGKEKLLGHIRKSIAELKDAAVLAAELADACSQTGEKVNYGKASLMEKDIKKMELANMLVAGALQGLLFKTMERSTVQDVQKEESRAFQMEFYTHYKEACGWVSRLMEKAGEAYENDKELTY